MNLANFSMDTITLAGSLESKLDANVAAGFTQITLWRKTWSVILMAMKQH